MDIEQILDIIRKNPGKASGIAMGLVFGWFAISYGILKAVFVSLCIVGGYYIGRHIDSRGGLKEFFTGQFREK